MKFSDLYLEEQEGLSKILDENEIFDIEVLIGGTYLVLTKSGSLYLWDSYRATKNLTKV